jgi:hypothetical protein
VDVKVEASRLNEMLGFSGGQRLVPVIVEAGRVTIGHGGT